MGKLKCILEEDLDNLSYVMNALTVLETAMSPDNEAGILREDIICNNLIFLSNIIERSIKSINTKVGAFNG